MRAKNEQHTSPVPEVQELVLSSLEFEQLAGHKKRPIARRQLRGFEKFLLWSLRIYVLFMTAVVVYQVLAGAR